jgi:hypothetical protein
MSSYVPLQKQNIQERLDYMSARLDSLEDVVGLIDKKLDYIIGKIDPPVELEQQPVLRDLEKPSAPEGKNGKKEKIKKVDDLLKVFEVIKDRTGAAAAYNLTKDSAKTVIDGFRSRERLDLSTKWSHLSNDSQTDLINELESIMAARNVQINRAKDQWIARQILSNKWANTVPRMVSINKSLLAYN